MAAAVAQPKMNPLLRASLTSASLMAIGDVVCQKVQGKSIVAKVDWARVCRFGLVGAMVHGPFFSVGMTQLDKVVAGPPSLQTATIKSLVGQVTLFPTYLASFFMAMAVLEGAGVEGGIDRLKTRFLPTCKTGTVWIAVNLINFRFVPPAQRLLFINMAGIAWNTYLSFVNSAPKPEAPKPVEEATKGKKKK